MTDASQVLNNKMDTYSKCRLILLTKQKYQMVLQESFAPEIPIEERLYSRQDKALQELKVAHF